MKAAVQKLSSLPIAHIYSFEDVLSEKLYTLDQQKNAEQIGENAFLPNIYFSVDAFLYIRACVVANGREVYNKVFARILLGNIQGREKAEELEQEDQVVCLLEQGAGLLKE